MRIDRYRFARLVGSKRILSLLAAVRSIGSKMRLCEASCQRERGKREIGYPRGCILSNCILCPRKPVVVSSFPIIRTRLLQDVTPSGLHLMLEIELSVISLLFDISSMLSSKSHLWYFHLFLPLCARNWIFASCYLDYFQLAARMQLTCYLKAMSFVLNIEIIFYMNLYNIQNICIIYWEIISR